MATILKAVNAREHTHTHTHTHTHILKAVNDGGQLSNDAHEFSFEVRMCSLSVQILFQSKPNNDAYEFSVAV